MTKELAKSIVKEIAKLVEENCAKCPLAKFCNSTGSVICADAVNSLKRMEE